jgi:NitT/TauT family transport system ATP-binding protein
MKSQTLVLSGIRKEFASRQGDTPIMALRGVSTSIPSGQFVSLLGRSGCGKSTLLAIISGLENPTSGEILLGGEPVSSPNRHRMLMFQDPALFPWLDVKENVLYGLSLVEDLSRAEKLERADHYLNLVGLSEFHHFRIHELSGGMRQRVALARALSPDPDVLLMDEPFSALDAMTREQLYADMQRIRLETKKTILMVTHNAREASCLSNRVLLMEDGTLVGDITISLPYPRSMNDLTVTESAAEISRHLLQAFQSCSV